MSHRLDIPILKHSLHAEPLPGMEDTPSKKGCYQTHGPVGITSTPVIDPADWNKEYNESFQVCSPNNRRR